MKVQQQQPQQSNVNSIKDEHISNKKNNFDVQQFVEKQNWTKLQRIRLDIAKNSIKKSMIRLHTQKIFQQTYDQIEIQQIFDQKVTKNINYQEYSSQYADTSAINKGQFSENGNFYGTVGSSGQGTIWNTSNSNDEKAFTQKVTSLKSQIKLCDIAFHPQIQKIPAFAPNICTSSSNGQLFFWTFDPKLPQQKSFKLKPHSDRINSVEYHQSGNYLLCSSYDMSWSFWDCSKLQQIFVQRGHQKEIHCSTIHPDGSLYFTGDLGGYGQIWDLRTGKGIYEMRQSDSILCCDFSSNGYELALGGKSNLITIKDIRRLKSMKQIPAHTKLISGLKYDKNESILCSVSHDNMLKLWHGRSYVPVNLQPMVHNSKVTSVDIHEGKIGTTLIERKWVIWLLRNGQQEKFQTKLQAKQEQQVEQDDNIF